MAALGRVSALGNLKSFAKCFDVRGTVCKAAATAILKSGSCTPYYCRSRYFSSFKGVSEVPAFRPSLIQSVRHYAELPDPTFAQIEERVMGLLKLFDKVSRDKLAVDAHFINDLGLDSLDVVEIIMAVEDEFALEIPDKHAEALFTPKDVVEYLADKMEAFE